MSLLLSEKLMDSSQLLLCTLDDVPISELLNAAALGSSNRTFFDAIKTDKRRREWLMWHVMIRDHFRDTAPEVEACYDERGIPQLSDPSYGHISVSHGGNLVGVMISRRVCGIDIESVDRNFTRAESRFLTADERIILDRLHHIAQPAPLAWCGKETAYKIGRVIGADFIRDIEIVNVCPINDTITVRICDKTVTLLCKMMGSNLIVYG